MLKNKVLLTTLLTCALTGSFINTAFAACRTETKFNEFTRTWSTNDVCDFGTLPVNGGWSFSSALAFTPLYVAPTYVVPTYDWALPSWSFADIYTLPIYYNFTSPAVNIPTYVDSEGLETPFDVYDHSSGNWLPAWVEQPVDRFTDYCEDFFLD